MKINYPINFHKGLTFLIVLGLMVLYDNFTIGAWVYLALHSTYGFLWLIKDTIFPDKQWEQEIPTVQGIITFFILGLYWIAPFILISSGTVPPLPLVAAAIVLNIVGVFLHFTSDAQKYYTLKYKTGLITEGFFAKCRNTNYLGEVLIYLAFAMLTQHWLPFLILGLFIAMIFVPNMNKKDKSLSRYPDFEEYKERSGLLFPKLLISRNIQEEKTTA
ncbi:methyltransferase family protein [Anabaena sp. WFMT]|uniref:methyltransferase family protein n=1 Tax=Anabaena sp. WFMT TaxID=3449730 RepID=UPI003F1ED62F